jgi:hypothetical protein
VIGAGLAGGAGAFVGEVSRQDREDYQHSRLENTITTAVRRAK